MQFTEKSQKETSNALLIFGSMIKVLYFFLQTGFKSLSCYLSLVMPSGQNCFHAPQKSNF